jgi:hypothetical protein
MLRLQKQGDYLHNGGHEPKKDLCFCFRLTMASVLDLEAIRIGRNRLDSQTESIPAFARIASGADRAKRLSGCEVVPNPHNIGLLGDSPRLKPTALALPNQDAEFNRLEIKRASRSSLWRTDCIEFTGKTSEWQASQNSIN